MPDKGLVDEKLGDKWGEIFKIRAEILKALEAARNGGLIGHSLDAQVVLYPDAYNHNSSLQELLKTYEKDWADIAIVSQVKLQKGALPPELGEASQALDGNSLGASGQTQNDSGWWYTSSSLRGAIAIYKADGEKCQRCWNYRSVDKDLKVCGRCSEVLRPESPS
jgi:isoleucyl-tRNA synthetase